MYLVKYMKFLLVLGKKITFTHFIIAQESLHPVVNYGSCTLALNFHHITVKSGDFLYFKVPVTSFGYYKQYNYYVICLKMNSMYETFVFHNAEEKYIVTI